MIRGWAHRQTMKCPCLIPRVSSKEENTGQAMAINGARSLGEGQGGASGENINDAPMVETPQPHRLPMPWQTGRCLVGCGL